jgi:hypothetical protein
MESERAGDCASDPEFTVEQTGKSPIDISTTDIYHLVSVLTPLLQGRGALSMVMEELDLWRGRRLACASG